MTFRRILLTLLVAIVVLSGCGGSGTVSPSPASREPVVKGLVFAWGVHAPKNVLVTQHGTFTKDVVLAKPLTVPFRLDAQDMASINRKLIAIDFWSYPSRYVSQGQGPRAEPPAGMEYRNRLTVMTAEGSKTVSWSGGYFADDRRAQDLRDLAMLIQRIVESKPQYKQLPRRRAGICEAGRAAPGLPRPGRPGAARPPSGDGAQAAPPLTRPCGT